MDLLDLKYLLGKKGLTFTAIDRLNGLREGSCRLAVSKPHKMGEQVLAKALGIPAYEFFPERYDKNGKRYNPQPRENYNYSTGLNLTNDKVKCKNSSNFVAESEDLFKRQSLTK